MLTIPLGLHSGDLREWLRQAHGIEITARQLNYAAVNDRIPKPLTTASGDHAWRPDDLPAVLSYFRDPVKPGRPRRKAS